MSDSVINLLLVDDHIMFLDGLKEILSNVPELRIVATASDGDEALTKLEAHQVDILITDLRMKGVDGRQLSQTVKEKYPDVKILVVSMHNDPSIVGELLGNGISGYILKNTGKSELLEAISKLSLGGTFFGEEVMTKYMNSKISGKNFSNPTVSLTSREREVLELIAGEFTTSEMAEKLFISLNTVETHRKNILRKLEVRNSVGLVKKAMEMGLLG